MTKRTTGLPVSLQGLFILNSLSESPKHGYAIAKHVLDLSNGKVKFSAATLYENIAGLLDGGFIERDAERDIAPGQRRKTYRITGKGARAMNEMWSLLRAAEGQALKPALGATGTETLQLEASR